MDKIIYVDNAATTALNQDVLATMLPYLSNEYGNASSVYSVGRSAKQALDDARDKVADIICCEPRELFFTGSGTEADNWAIKGVAYANKNRGNHIITTSIEHHAVLHTCQNLEKNGFEVTYLPVDSDGMVTASQVREAIRPTTILVSIMFANNEIGTILPIAEIGKITREKGIYFHTDAVQAVGHVAVNVRDLNVDMLTMSAHKFNGPKGVGALYVRKGVKIDPILHGGAQERGRRAGTENVAGIVGLAAALELAVSELDKKSVKTSELRDYTIKKMMETIPHTLLNGHPQKRLPGNMNFAFEYIEGESLLLMLDMSGICASSGSACTSGSLDPSHVLLAIGLKHEIAHGSLRVSIDEHNTKEEMDFIIDKLVGIVQRLRDMSPLYQGN